MEAVEDRFFRPRRRVTIVDFGSTLEALCLRSLLEAMGVSVVVHFIGAPQDLFAALDQEAPPEVLVLCGHGAESGLVLGSYGESIDTSCLIDGCLPAVAIAGKVALKGTIVLSTACLSGLEAYAQAFLGGGASLYAGPCEFPGGADVLLFTHQFLHGLLIKGDDPRAAALEASRGCREPDLFRIFSHDDEGSVPPEKISVNRASNTDASHRVADRAMTKPVAF